MGKLKPIHHRIITVGSLVVILLTALPLRGEAILSDVRLMAADLVDEVVYTWTQSKPFSPGQKVALTDVRAPVSFDQRFDQVVENRLYELIRINPQIPIVLVHCAICRELTAKSTPDKTYIGLGVDNPEVMEAAARMTPGLAGLSLAFEVRGEELELRAVVYQMTAPQKIIWAQRFSTTSTSILALQRGDHLIDLADARQRQEELLSRRDSIETTTRLSLRVYSSADAGQQIAPLPFIEQTFEGIVPPLHNTRLGISVGFTSIKDSYEGWTVGAQFSRLMLASTPHLSNPDLYWTFGFNYIRLHGPNALPFAQNELDITRIEDPEIEPRATLLNYRLGLELHVKHRFGLSSFMEYAPTLKESKLINTKKLLSVPYQAVGIGVIIRW